MADNFPLTHDLLSTSIYLRRVLGTQKCSESIIEHAWFGKIPATYCSNHWYDTVTTSFPKILVTILFGEKLLFGSYARCHVNVS